MVAALQAHLIKNKIIKKIFFEKVQGFVSGGGGTRQNTYGFYEKNPAKKS